MRPSRSLRLAELAATAAFGAGVLCAIVLVVAGPGTFSLVGGGSLSFASRIDAVSVTMLVLVGAIGWVVTRYSGTYLDGEIRQGRFTGWMSLTLAAVLFFVQAGTLTQLAVGWVAMSLTMNRLLRFYPERIGARRAARKEFVTSRLGDVALLLAIMLLVAAYGTDGIAAIAAAARIHTPPEAIAAAVALAVAALVKSAQFPVHGWLTRVMETPTPVSALLHAGIVNAGGFLLIRMSDVMIGAPGAMALLVMVGGFTALFGSLAMLTQPAVKTSLALSTVAQMGFMVLQCGLALFPLALLHIVAHSLYKAHAFLASGEAVETVARISRPGPVAIPGRRSVLLAFLIALGIYAVVAALFGLDGKSPQAIALGAILIFGVAYLLAQGLADAAPWALTWRTALYALAAAIGYFALQRGSEWLMAGTLTAPPPPGPLEWALVLLALVSFAMVAVAQAMFPLWAYHPAARPLRVHLANGLYADALFDRILGTWSIRPRCAPTPRSVS